MNQLMPPKNWLSPASSSWLGASVGGLTTIGRKKPITGRGGPIGWSVITQPLLAAVIPSMWGKLLGLSASRRWELPTQTRTRPGRRNATVIRPNKPSEKHAG